MKFKSYLKYLLILVVAGIIGVAIFLTLDRRPEEEEPPEVVPPPVQEETVEPEPAEEEIENLYTSSSNRFPDYSFICPEGWELTGNGDGSRIIARDGQKQAVMVMVEEVAGIGDIELEEMAQEYLDITGDLQDSQTLEQEFAFGPEESILYGYRYDSGLEPDSEQVDILSWQEREGYLYILKYMASGMSTVQATESFKEFAASFSWEDDLPRTAEEQSSRSVNILILGDDSSYERAGGRISGRTDINMILHLNLEEKKAVIVTIPRDTWVDIPGHGENKINAANAFGGPELAVETFQQFSGMEIDSYIITDFDGFVPLIDLLGGVTVEVTEDLADGFSGCYLDKGVHHLDGEQALALSRNRKRPGGAYAREEEAAKIIVALYEQKTTLEKVLKLPAFINYLLNYTWTDMNLDTVLMILPAMGKIKPQDIEITTIPSWPQMIGNVSAVVYDPEATAQLFEDIQSR
ncbi:MAG: LCP family protein [Actinomycetota bacterium]